MSFVENRNEKVQEQLSGLLEELKSREKFKEMTAESMAKLKEWNDRVKPILNASTIFAQHIKGLEVWKRIIALQTISQPQPFHTIAIGDPASAKSETAQAFMKATATSGNPVEYVWATKMTSAGLTLSVIGDNLMVGALPRCHMGQLFVDEFDKAPAQEAGALLGSMQHGWFGVEKATIKCAMVPAKVAIAALANPLGDYWRSIHPAQIKSQLPFASQALLTRFHLIVIIRRPEIEEFEAISKHQIESDMKNLDPNKLNSEDVEMWHQLVYYLRHVRIGHYENPSKSDAMITAFTTSAYRQDRRFKLAIPISPRLNDGILRMAMSYAKAQLRDTVSIKDTIRAILLTAETLVPCGLDTEASFKAVKKATKIEIRGDQA